MEPLLQETNIKAKQRKIRKSNCIQGDSSALNTALRRIGLRVMHHARQTQPGLTCN